MNSVMIKQPEKMPILFSLSKLVLISKDIEQLEADMMEAEEEYPDETSKVLNTINLNFSSVKDPTYYYYKRWLWIIFPWACMKASGKYDYSRAIAQCFPANIRYLSVAEDRLLTSCRY